MKTLAETGVAVREAFTGDVERDLFELGLTFNEVWEASGDALANLVESFEGRINSDDIPTLMRNLFTEGVAVGVKFERERRS